MTMVHGGTIGNSETLVMTIVLSRYCVSLWVWYIFLPIYFSVNEDGSDDIAVQENMCFIFSTINFHEITN
jgi:hypothetical protein